MIERKNPCKGAISSFNLTKSRNLRLFYKLGFLGPHVLQSYEYLKCLSSARHFLPHRSSVASHLALPRCKYCIGWCPPPATLLSFAAKVEIGSQSLPLKITCVASLALAIALSASVRDVRLCMLNGIVLLSEKKGKC